LCTIVHAGTIRARPTGKGFLAFLERVARAYPKGDVHPILDIVPAHEPAAATLTGVRGSSPRQQGA